MGVNNTYQFNLDVYDVPRFSSKILPIYEVGIGNSKMITLPVIEEFEPINVIHSNLPPFVTFAPFFYSVQPKTKQHLGDFMVSGTLYNKLRASTSFDFKIRVINNPPRFTT